MQFVSADLEWLVRTQAFDVLNGILELCVAGYATVGGSSLYRRLNRGRAQVRQALLVSSASQLASKETWAARARGARSNCEVSALVLLACVRGEWWEVFLLGYFPDLCVLQYANLYGGAMCSVLDCGGVAC